MMPVDEVVFAHAPVLGHAGIANELFESSNTLDIIDMITFNPIKLLINRSVGEMLGDEEFLAASRKNVKKI